MSEHSLGVEDDGASNGIVRGPDSEGAAVLQGRRRENGTVAIGVVVKVAEKQSVEAVRLALASVPDNGDNFGLESYRQR